MVLSIEYYGCHRPSSFGHYWRKALERWCTWSWAHEAEPVGPRQQDTLSRNDTGGGREIDTESRGAGAQPVGAGSHPCPASLGAPGSLDPPSSVTKTPCRHLRPTPRTPKAGHCRYRLVYDPELLLFLVVGSGLRVSRHGNLRRSWENAPDLIGPRNNPWRCLGKRLAFLLIWNGKVCWLFWWEPSMDSCLLL